MFLFKIILYNCHVSIPDENIRNYQILDFNGLDDEWDKFELYLKVSLNPWETKSMKAYFFEFSKLLKI